MTKFNQLTAKLSDGREFSVLEYVASGISGASEGHVFLKVAELEPKRKPIDAWRRVEKDNNRFVSSFGYASKTEAEAASFSDEEAVRLVEVPENAAVMWEVLQGDCVLGERFYTKKEAEVSYAKKLAAGTHRLRKMIEVKSDD